MTLELDRMYVNDVTFSPYHRLLRGAPLLAAALLIVLLTGCHAGKSWKDPGPRESFERFLTLWHRGEDASAFELIAPADREAITAPRAALKGKVPDPALPEPHGLLAVATVDHPFSIARITTEAALDEEPAVGQQVTLTLSYQDGRTGSATMVWGGDRWYVDLPLTGSTSGG